MADRVREPIQVYLTGEERAELDRRAEEHGVSRSEALRRGIQALGRPATPGPLLGLPLSVFTPPIRSTGIPPRGQPVAPLHTLLGELDRDRRER
ncbi:MAG: ribbon-helix-helix protein, CopG family [Gemmatimonadetes bacterium]|nr:ribbon-helix-helix protein, CopG family [Gemmatimonadota bacterium]